MESAKAESKVYIQRESQRRLETTSVQFPLLDSDFNIVRQDRRRIVDRRKSNLKLLWQENQPIRNTSSLTLQYEGKNFYFDENLQQFIVGRSHESELRIDNRFISRKHALFSYKNGEFVLTDNSLNGTFIETEDLGKIRIHGQKVYLYGNGIVSLGRPIDADESTLIHFQCD